MERPQNAPNALKRYLEAYVAWENSVHTQLAEINGQLIKLGLPYEAKLVREGEVTVTFALLTN